MNFLRVASARNALGFTPSGWRRSMAGIADGGMGSSWKDRESAAEELYFSKEDAAALARLSGKLHAHHAPAPEVVTKEKKAVGDILAKHGVPTSESLVEDLFKFKYPDH